MRSLELTDPTPDGCRRFLREASAMGIRAVEFDCGTWPGAVGSTFTMLYDTGGRRADSLPIQAFATSDSFDGWRKWAGGKDEVPLSEMEAADITDDPDHFSSYFDEPIDLAVYPVDERAIKRGHVPVRRGGLSVSVTMSPTVVADALEMDVAELRRACNGRIEQVLDAVESDLEEYILDMCANRDYDVALSASEAIDRLERKER